MAIKLTLYQKGIIVIGVPLLIQVGFFALYTSMLEQCQIADIVSTDKEQLNS